MAERPVVYRNDVQTSWLDYNNHMGDFAYGIVFSLAGDGFLEFAGLDPAYRDRTHCTIYTLETHTRFMREVAAGDSIYVTAQLLDCDEKRVHLHLEMYDGKDQFVAEQEQLVMHMRRDPGTSPVPAPFPPGMKAIIDEYFAVHRLMPRPTMVGAPMGIRRKKGSS